MKQQVLKIHKDDNVLVALTDLSKGATIVYENETYILQDDIHAKHKFFTQEQMGEDILEYCIKAASGEVIPKAVLLNQDDFIPWKRGVSL